MKLKIVILLVCLVSFTYACNEITSTSGSTIDFLPQANSQNTQWLEDVTVDSGSVELDIWGLYAVNEEILFLFGGLDAAIFSLQTMLLRSDDSGRTWREVMEPEPGSDIIDFALTENGYGWALALWTIETPGLGRLYRTVDYGISWQKVSDIPNLGGLSYPTNFQLVDDQNGEVRINVNDASCNIITTTNGGYSWKESSLQRTNDMCFFRRSNETVGFDGTQWRFVPLRNDLRLSTNGVVEINRLDKDGNWILISELPETIPYEIIQSGGEYQP